MLFWRNIILSRFFHIFYIGIFFLSKQLKNNKDSKRFLKMTLKTIFFCLSGFTLENWVAIFSVLFWYDPNLRVEDRTVT